MVCSFYAVGRLQLADFTALSFTQPLFVTVLAVALLGEVVRWRRWVATAVGFLGVLVMVRPGASTFDPAALVSLPSGAAIALSAGLLKRLPVAQNQVTSLR